MITRSARSMGPVGISRWKSAWSIIFLASFVALSAPKAVAFTLFSDAFTRGSDPGPLNAWNIAAGTWNVTGGAFEGAGTSLGSYAFSYITNSWTNYSVAARIQFPAGGYGGGIGARLNPLTGE